MSLFIQIDIDKRDLGGEVAEKLVALCPVDIFALEEGYIVARAEQMDECTLCEICLDITPENSLTIRKKYKDEQLVSRGVKN